MHGHNAEAQQDSADSSSEHKHAAVASAPLYHTDHPSRHWDRTCPACIAESAQNDTPAIPKGYRLVCKECGSIPGDVCLAPSRCPVHVEEVKCTE